MTSPNSIYIVSCVGKNPVPGGYISSRVEKKYKALCSGAEITTTHLMVSDSGYLTYPIADIVLEKIKSGSDVIIDSKSLGLFDQVVKDKLLMSKDLTLYMFSRLHVV